MMAVERDSRITLSFLLDGIANVAVAEDCEVTGLCLDSRKILPGDCFVALDGANHHGAAYCQEAKQRGASAVLIEGSKVAAHCAGPVVNVTNLRERLGDIADKFFSSPSKDVQIVAVTGTNGKTTVSSLCAQALALTHGTSGYVGTLGIGEIGALQSIVNTTPDSITLQQFFADLRHRRVRTAAIEASSHGISQGRLNGTSVDVGVFTNLGHDHLDYHQDLQAYAAAKKRLFHEFGIRYAVVNCDDPVGRQLLTEFDSSVVQIGYSAVGNANTTYALNVLRSNVDRRGIVLEIQTPDGLVRLSSSLIGDYNVENLLATFGALIALGIEPHDAAALLENVQAVPGRMQRVISTNTSVPEFIVDYAHTPDSLDVALRSVAKLTEGSVICVFGCGGDRDATKRAPMGHVAERGADTVIITSDNPRSESPSDIAQDILGGMRDPMSATVVHDRREAIELALEMAAPEDVVLVAGKGHENEQLVGSQRLDFSDVTVIEELIAGSLR